MQDYTKAAVDPQTRGMLDFAVKLTREPGSMVEEDVQELRDLGLNDRQVLSVVLLAAWYNFQNRLASGLGAPVDQRTDQRLREWLGESGPQHHWLVPGRREDGESRQ